MKPALLRRIATLPLKERRPLNAFLENRERRLAVVKAMQAKGVGVGIDPDNIAKWLELILKFLPLFLQIILPLLAKDKDQE